MVADLFQRLIMSWEELTPFFNNDLVVAFLVAAFMFASYTDMLEYKIYDKFNIFLFGARVVFTFIPVYTLEMDIWSFLGAAVSFLALIIPAVVFLQKMGGDIKFMTVMGLYLGLGLSIFTLILGCFYMLLFSLGRKIVTRKNVRRLKAPMAPFFFIAFYTLLIIAKCF